MNRFEASSQIDAPVSLLWELLTAFDGYSRWNPLLIGMEGRPVLGKGLAVSIQLPDVKRQDVNCIVTRLEQHKELAWSGCIRRPNLIHLDHNLFLESIDSARTRFHQTLSLRGPAAWFIGRWRDGLPEGLHLMNWRLKRVAEAGSIESWLRERGKTSCDYDWDAVNQCRSFHDVPNAIRIIRRSPRKIEHLQLADWYCDVDEKGRHHLTGPGAIGCGYRPQDLPAHPYPTHPILIGSIGGRIFVIDGAHRLARALHCELPSIAVVRLSEEETAQCVRDGFELNVQRKYAMPTAL